MNWNVTIYMNTLDEETNGIVAKCAVDHEDRWKDKMGIGQKRQQRDINR